MFCERCQQRPAVCQVGQHLLCQNCALHKALLPALMQPSHPPALSCCPGCGCTWQQLNSSSHLGCADCYRHFRPGVEKTVVRLHGHFQHNGRRPRRQRATDPDQLRQLLAQAVAEERYEEAAQLRDQLRKLSS